MSTHQKIYQVGSKVGLFLTMLALLWCTWGLAMPHSALAQTKFDGKCEDPNGNINADNCAPVAYVLLAINVLSAVMGVIVVIMIAYGGVQYTMAKDNPQQITEAREKIRNAVLAFLAYLFMFSFLQWVVPGGIF